MRPLAEGWKWSGENLRFEFSKKSFEEDMLSSETDQARTSICEFLVFEGEEGGMFCNSRLPTLDTEIWVDEKSEKIMNSFFEKPTCPNRVEQHSHRKL